MKSKLTIIIELLIVNVFIALVAAFASSLVSLGGNRAVRMVITVLVYVVMAGIPFAVCRVKKISFADVGYSKDRMGMQLLISLALFAVTISLTVVIPLLVGLNKSDVLGFKSPSIGIVIFYFLYDFFFVGFGEEFIFRGYNTNRLVSLTKSMPIAILVSSLLFGLWHYPAHHNIAQVVVTTLIGLLYGFARYKVKNCTLLSVSVAHGLQDAVIVLLSYFLL